MKALVVDDDGLLIQTIAALLGRKGFNVTTAKNGSEALKLLSLYPFDVVLLDLRLRNESGLDVLREIRLRKVPSPVVVLSGDDEIETKVTALNAGADDYVTKPFRIDELVARIQAVVRRTNGHTEAVMQIGGLTLDLAERRVLVGEQVVKLTIKEYDLLETLALRRGRTLSKEDLLGRLYGGIDEPGVKIIDVFICKLRRKLSEALGAEAPIETVWARGYRIAPASSDAMAA